MKALGYEEVDDIVQGVRDVLSTKDGCLVWGEFVDFFFLKQAQLEKKNLMGGSDNWWRRIESSE